jgi:hypothetical protein
MVSFVNKGTIILLIVAIIALTIVMYLGYKSKYRTRNDLETILKTQSIPYTNEELTKNAKSIKDMPAIEILKNNVTNMNDAVQYVQHKQYEEKKTKKAEGSTALLTDSSWKFIAGLLLLLCAISFFFIPPEFLYYGYFVGVVALLLLVSMLNSETFYFKWVLLVTLLLSAVLIYLGVKEIIIFNTASGGSGGVSSKGYLVYDINNPDSLEGSIKYY